MKKRLLLIVIGMAVSLAGLLASPKLAWADLPYDPNNLISDSIFTDSTVMSAADIQSFLNSKNSGIKNLTDTESCSPPTPTSPDPYASSYYAHCGSTQSAANIIYDAAQAYHISPRVILATMQKEQSLVTDPTPWQNNSAAVNCAMGYLSCGSVSGFFNQVDNGTWQLRTDVELMSGRSWWGYSPSSYPCSDAHAGTPSHSNGGNVGNGAKYYSTGLYPGRTVTFYNYNGDAYSTLNLANSSTAALYCYTPHVGPYSQTGFSGSYNFVQSFEQWWGTVYGDQIGSVAYRLWGAGSHDHYYTAKDLDRANAKQYAGFKDDGIAFNVGTDSTGGMIPIYSEYNGRLSDHWYIPDGPNRYWAIVQGGYREDGIAFYAYPANSTGSASACSQGNPVYQMWHGGYGDHFYSTSSADRYWALIYGGYVDDGSGTYKNSNVGSVSFCTP